VGKDQLPHGGGDPGPYPCKAIAWFVLRRAGELLDRGDAATLLEIAAQEEQRAASGDAYAMISHLWRLVAARLEPKRFRS
jgi:hypothetical protein